MPNDHGPGALPAVFHRGRSETIRYHEELYAHAELGVPGSWLARPHPLVLAGLWTARESGPIVAYDLGAGVGRHTVPMAQGLADGSRVIAVDLLQTAIDRLRTNCARAGVEDAVVPVVHDLETFDPADDAGLVVAFSAIEHVSSVEAMRRLLTRMASMTHPGGVHVIGVVCDRTEVAPNGTSRPAIVEFPLTSEAALAVVDRTYSGWDVRRRTTRPSRVAETRDGERYEMISTLVELVAVKSD